MKMLMMVVLLGGLIAMGAWKMGYFKEKPKEEPKIEAKAEESKAPEATQVSDADKAKADAEAKAKSESEAKAQGDKLKADAEAKISELKKQYAEKKASYMALSKEKKTYEAALKELDSVSPDFVAAIPEQQRKAKDLASQIRSMSEKVSKQGSEVDKAKRALSQSDCVLAGSRSKSDRIGWYYSSDPGHRYSMSQIGIRDRKKAIKYVYKEDTTQKDSVTAATSAYKKECQELDQIKSQLVDLKKQMDSFKAEYQSALSQKIESLSSDMNNAKEEGKKLDSEIDSMKQS